jgi:hypothetical protein
MTLPFPLDLPGPVIKAIGSVFFIALLLRCVQWVDAVAATSIYPAFWWLSFLIVPLVFVIVLACGYIEILRQLVRKPGPGKDAHGEVIHAGNPGGEQGVQTARSWEDIGAESRLMLYDIIHRFRQEIKK